MTRKNNLQEFYYFLQDLQDNKIFPIKYIYFDYEKETLDFIIVMKKQYNLELFYKIFAEKNCILNCIMKVKTINLNAIEELTYSINLDTKDMIENLTKSINTLINHYKLENKKRN